ncbi:MAG: CoA-transferase [Acidimicrobiia bacterium]
MNWTPAEMMVVAAARHLGGQRNCFVGIGLPNLACSLAKRSVAPDLELIYESGVVGADPARLALSIGDPTLVVGARAIVPMFDLFSLYLQGGRIDVAFLGAAQIDRRGSVNTTVIGSYQDPSMRLPGSGGACEIALNAQRVFFIVKQSPRSFVERLDFVTSPGHIDPHPGRGEGPSLVVTQLGVYEFVDGEMTLVSLHPGVSVEDVIGATEWDMAIGEITETPLPTIEELQDLRALDPTGVYLS